MVAVGAKLILLNVELETAVGGFTAGQVPIDNCFTAKRRNERKKEEEKERRKG